MNHSTSQGFTLIELLVVIAIIGMVATLVTPTIQSSIEQAKSAKCQNNLRQIGTAVLQYVADPANNNQFPPIFDPDSASMVPLRALSNYGVTLSVLTCPSATTVNPDYGSYMWSPNTDEELASSVKIYRRGRVVNAPKLSRLTLCSDMAYPHLRKQNRLWADGHVDIITNPFLPAR
jgi:prepilin-type N-terminal cleavage/methylation domain-containing protein